MNASEARIHDLLTQRGYRVLRRGWPDFLVMDELGFRGFPLEVKSPGDAFWSHGPSKLSPEQEDMHWSLQRLGLPATYVCWGNEEKLLSHCQQTLRAPTLSLTERRLAKMRKTQAEADRARAAWERWAARSPEKAQEALAKEALRVQG
jgi:hypothetical protein